MTEKQLAEIEARANAATPGPWKRHQNADEGHFVSTHHRKTGQRYYIVQLVHGEDNAYVMGT